MNVTAGVMEPAVGSGTEAEPATRRTDPAAKPARMLPGLLSRVARWALQLPAIAYIICAACPAIRRRTWVVSALLAVLAVTASGCTGSPAVRDASNPVVQRSQAVVARALRTTGDYSGPQRGPPAQRPGLIVFVAADLSNGGIAGVAQGAEQAARAIGWPLRILDGQASVQGQTAALRFALTLKPAGIILCGFDAAGQQTALQQARAQGIAVVGWHSAARPGPDPNAGLFTNVTTNPAEVALLASSYVIAESGGTARVVIFTDSEYAIETYKADVMASMLKKCRRCSVLQIVNAPIANAQVNVPAVINSLLVTYGKHLSYFLAVNGAYLTGARVALFGAGVPGDQSPFSVAAGDGDASELERIRAGDHQQATVAEPLYLQGWQLIDEINRARAGQPPSGYVAPPHLITKADVPNGAVFDPRSGYRENYLRIWRR
jgi:ribose transport system substrate-binding protein